MFGVHHTIIEKQQNTQNTGSSEEEEEPIVIRFHFSTFGGIPRFVFHTHFKHHQIQFNRSLPQTMSSSSGHPQTSSASAIRALQMELRSLQSQPLEGFTVTCDDDNMFKWTVGIFGPPGTLYQGGYFKAHLKFPTNYPYSPPTMRFIHPVWHPNVYENGDICISILHPPVDDPHSGEMPSERWNPTQSVRTVLLSVISLLNEPNTSSPANVDASVMYRKYKDHGDQEYATIIRKQVEKSKEEAKKDGIKVPETIDEYVVKAKPRVQGNESNDVIELDEDYYDYEDDDTDEDAEYGGEEEQDSGQGDDES
ncbi:hypothetical protein niasHS_006140 [Heterodera schachtii]|uniref:UBC core domain-containing protein n=1 Tax=Heterodera schachtii TaxID=97005 RepID=A0ABD2JW16_HETSC